MTKTLKTFSCGRFAHQSSLFLPYRDLVSSTMTIAGEKRKKMGVPLHFANVLVDPPRMEVREERGPTSGGAAPVMRCWLLAVAVRACALLR